MKKLILLPALALFLFSFNTSEECQLMYTNATYGIMHSKKALDAKNYDDQRYFAKKALESYYRILENINSCGGDIIAEKVEDTINYLESATDPYDWAKGRYYSKKAYLNSLELITELDELTAQAEHE